MSKYIILFFTISGGIWFANRNIQLDGWDWALQVFFGAFAGWSISSVILKASGNMKNSKHSKEMIGIISNIGYSTIRINNMPRYKVTIRYSGLEKAFEPIAPDIQFSLSIGDKAIVYVNPEKIQDAYFDVKKSIQYKKANNQK